MKSLKDLMFLNFKPWALLGLLAVPIQVSANELDELVSGIIPLPVTAWFILVFTMGFLAISKRRNS